MLESPLTAESRSQLRLWGVGWKTLGLEEMFGRQWGLQESVMLRACCLWSGVFASGWGVSSRSLVEG